MQHNYKMGHQKYLPNNMSPYKAFLMIKLGSLEDRNRFYFFMKEGHKLVCFSYTTIIFNFNASSFILNFVIKHHANKFPADNCTDMLKKILCR